jgi:hypothetical protein
MPDVRVSIVDLVTGARVRLGEGLMPPGAIGERRAYFLDSRTHRLTGYDLTGQLRRQLDDVQHFVVGARRAGESSPRIVYVLGTGEVMELRVDSDDPPRRIWQVGTRVVRDRMVSLVEFVSMTREGIWITEILEDGARRYVLVDETGAHVQDLGKHGFLMFGGRTVDGTWWAVEDMERVIRIPVGGPATVVRLDTDIRSVSVREDQVWAVGRGVVKVLASDGSVARSISVPGSENPLRLRNEILLRASEGLVRVAPSSNTRFLLPLPSGIYQHAGDHDGRAFVAVTHVGDAWSLAVWTDPVPRDPAALPAYLDQLTNARLSLGSDLVTWDPSMRQP